MESIQWTSLTRTTAEELRSLSAVMRINKIIDTQV